MTYYLGKKKTYTYEIGVSCTATSEKEVIFSTKHKLIFKLAYLFFKKKYKNKMFVWRRINCKRYILHD